LHRYQSPLLVLPWVFLGSCPRQLEDVTLKLKEELGVTILMNFQEGDVDMNPETMIQGLIPLTCPCMLPPAGRTTMLPQNVFLLHGLLENGHTVYVHCKADVDRSTTVVCGLLMFVLGWSKRKVHYFVTPRSVVV
uniref:EPM2A glucan phosphatase, laforin n=1 Tax=Salmo trutta TaxID=8032 RepID=A0A673YAA2_SALTR